MIGYSRVFLFKFQKKSKRFEIKITGFQSTQQQKIIDVDV